MTKTCMSYYDSVGLSGIICLEASVFDIKNAAMKLIMQGQRYKLFLYIPETIMQTSETGSDTGSTVTLQTSVASQAAVPTQVVQQVPVQQQVRTHGIQRGGVPYVI